MPVPACGGGEEQNNQIVQTAEHALLSAALPAQKQLVSEAATRVRN